MKALHTSQWIFFLLWIGDIKKVSKTFYWIFFIFMWGYPQRKEHGYTSEMEKEQNTRHAGLDRKLLHRLTYLNTVVPSWWCWGRLGGVTLLEAVCPWGYIARPYLQFALSTSCLQFGDASSQFFIPVIMPATCYYIFPPSWTLLPLKPEARGNSVFSGCS